MEVPALLLLLTSIAGVSCSVSLVPDVLKRHRRNLVYTPRNNIVQIILGTGVPVPLESQQAMTIGWVLKAAYPTPNNASVYTNPYVTVQKRSVDDDLVSRFDLYKAMDSVFGLLGGKGCVLRAICEASQTPFRASSLLGQIMYIIFAPSTTDEIPVVPTDHDYISAARLGADKNRNCGVIYSECLLSPLDMLSVIM